MLPFFNQNPQAVAIKKYLFELLKERYDRNQKYVDRLAAGTVTREDYDSLGRLMADLYESGFLRAVDQYREQVSRLGLKVDVVSEKPAAPLGPKIFDDG